MKDLFQSALSAYLVFLSKLKQKGALEESSSQFHIKEPNHDGFFVLDEFSIF